MTALLTQPLAPEMGSAVLAHLSQFAKLPDRGIVAGQAVTSALLAIHGDGVRLGPVNDIDVFVSNPRPRRTLEMSFAPSHAVYLGDGTLKFEDDEGYHTMAVVRMMLRQAYGITRVRRDGLLNFVDVNPKLPSERAQNISLPIHPADVVGSFDINCVEAAVNIETGRLYWSRGFEWFMRTAQLQVSNVHGEVHTMTRILKKLDEMPWIYCDIPTTAHALMLTLETKHLAAANTAPPAFVPELGPMYQSRFEKYADRLAPYFRMGAERRLESGTTLRLSHSTLPLEALDFEETREFRDLLMRYTVPGAIKGRAHVTDILPWVLQRAPSLAYEAKLRRGSAYERRLGAAVEGGLDRYSKTCLKIQGNGFLGGQVLSSTAAQLKDFLTSHYALKSRFALLSFSEQVQAMNALKSLDREFNGRAIGYVEHAGISPEALRNKDALRDVVATLNAELSRPFTVTPLRVPESCGPVHLRELLTQSDLDAEGRDMSHCVGGYGALVKDGLAGIVSLRTHGDHSARARSTLQLSIAEDRVSGRRLVSIAQHRGFANLATPEGHAEAAWEVAASVNARVAAGLPQTLSGPVNLRLTSGSHDVVYEPLTAKAAGAALAQMLAIGGRSDAARWLGSMQQVGRIQITERATGERDSLVCVLTPDRAWLGENFFQAPGMLKPVSIDEIQAAAEGQLLPLLRPEPLPPGAALLRRVHQAKRWMARLARSTLEHRPGA